MLDTLRAIEVPPFVVLLGALVGLSYGVLGLGLVLVYRLHRVVNLSQVATGAFGAAVTYTLWNSLGAPFPVALAGGTLAAAAVGGLVYAVVVRRLDGAPAALTMVATLGVSQLLTTYTTALTGDGTTRMLPGRGETVVHSGLPQFEVGPLLVSSGHVGMVLSGVVCTAALAYVLRATGTGRSIRAAADNGDAALLAGMPVRTLGAAAWGMAAGATTLMLTFATEAGYGSSTTATGGGAALPLSLTLMSFAAACCAGMSSLVGAVVAGVGLGIVSQVLRWNLGPSTPWVDVVLFVIVLVALLLVRRLRGRPGEGAGWVRAEIWSPVPRALGRLPLLRLGGPVASGLLIALVGAVVLVWPANSTAVVRLSAAALIAFGVCLLCGLAGEVSLGQLAVAGTGGVGSFLVVQPTGDFALAVVVAVLVGAAVGVLLGLPSLRLRGTALALTTLSFAVALPEMLFRPGGPLAGGPDPGQPVIGSLEVELGPRFALFSLALFTVGLAVVYAGTRGPLHRLVCAVRDNEPAAAAFGIRILRLRVWALAVSGGVSALGGVVLVHGSPRVQADLLPATTSVLILLGAVLGGMTSLLGAVLGVVLAVGAPLILPGSSLATQGTALFALLVLLLYPGGAVSVLRGLRERAVGLALRLHGVEAASGLAPAADGVGGTARGRTPIPSSLRPHGPASVVAGDPADTVLSACGLGRSFGGTVAVECVDLHLHRGEIVALVGPNGAGKTTTFELLSGFTRPDHGHVELRGQDVTGWSPQRRARAGLVRSFQNGQMFPSLTVEQCLAVALERSQPTSIALAMLGRETGPDRWAVVDDVVAYFGLEGYRNTRLGQLSTGTRRIVEIASVVASRPQAVLLDEPSAGIAESESSALAEELRRWRDELGLSILLIEHDLNLVSAVADRVVVMAEGRVISEGAPDEVWDDPAVLEGYVGTRHARRADACPACGNHHGPDDEHGHDHDGHDDEPALAVDVVVPVRPPVRGGRPR